MRHGRSAEAVLDSCTCMDRSCLVDKIGCMIGSHLHIERISPYCICVRFGML